MKKHIVHRHNCVEGKAIQLPLIYAARYNDSRVAFAHHVWPSLDAFTIHYVLEGTYTLKMSSGQSLSLTGKQFCVTPPGEDCAPESGTVTPSRSCHVALMRFPPDAISNSGLTEVDLGNIIQQLESAGTCTHPMGDPIAEQCEAFGEMLSIFTHEYALPFRAGMLRLIIVELLLLTAHQLAHPPEILKDIYAQSVTRYIEENLGEHITVQEIADHLGYSTRQTHSIIKNSTGFTPHAYLVHLRMSKACELLRNTDKRITDIALDTGFASSQHFSSVFKRYMDCSPTQYCQRNSGTSTA